MVYQHFTLIPEFTVLENIVLGSEPRVRPGEDALVVNNLWVRDDEGRYTVKGASFRVRMGEIYSIVSVEGNGQRELVEAVVGLRPYVRGEVVIKSAKRMLAYIPPDRTSEGLILDMLVSESSILGIHKLFALGGVAIKGSRVVRHAENLVRKYSIVAPSTRSPAKYLSGGNQQKLVIARELSKGSDLLVVSNPTRGLDIASTNYVRRLLIDLRTSGKPSSWLRRTSMRP